MSKKRIGINGFGRIGRCLTRISQNSDEFEIVHINTRSGKPEMLAYLLRYDSIYGRMREDISYTSDSLIINGQEIKLTNSDKIEDINWSNVDIVVDSTGAFRTQESLIPHINSTVKKVVLSAPPKDEKIPQVVLGVNDKEFDFNSENIISMASCTTNCVAPMLKVLNDDFEVISGFINTIHAYTGSQNLMDNSGKDFARARAAAENLVPTTTGATNAIGKVIPELNGKLDGLAIRTPLPSGSLTDLSVVLGKKTSVDEINELFKEVAEDKMSGILDYAEDVLVSTDIIGEKASVIFDPYSTRVVGNHIKIFGWYDNEWGYSSRLADLLTIISKEI